jgi:hypothetical protein
MVEWLATLGKEQHGFREFPLQNREDGERHQRHHQRQPEAHQASPEEQDRWPLDWPGWGVGSTMAVATPVEQLLGRMKADGLITENRNGDLLLRSYGRDVRLVLNILHAENGCDDEE